MNTIDLLNIAHVIQPERNSIIFEGRRWTFGQTKERILRLAQAMARLGIGKGDRVGMLQVNCPPYIEAYFAAASLGAIFLPLNFRAKADELRYLIERAGVRLLFIGNRYADLLGPLRSPSTTIEAVVTLDGALEGLLEYEDLISSSEAVEPDVQIDGKDITVLMFTSGTTGRPKGVPLSHQGLADYIVENVEPANPLVEEHSLITVPLYHIAGLQSVLSAVYGGKTLVLMRQFEVKEWLQTVEQERVNRAMLVPTMLKWILEDPDFERYDLSSLEVMTYGAAPMPFDVIKLAIEKMPGVSFFNAFGQTETASTIAVLGPEDHRLDGPTAERAKKIRRLTSSIGRPLADVEVKIMNEAGQAMPVGQVGEIVVRGPRLMGGYWADQEKTAKAFTPDGWLRTGDAGWMDEEGYIYLAGRQDDLIIRGGENISPEEVENVLQSHPKVEDAAVIGLPDPEWGQQPMAVVALKPGETADEEELMAHCRSRLSGFKRPRSIIFVESLPRNQLGKVLRKELRQRYGST